MQYFSCFLAKKYRVEYCMKYCRNLPRTGQKILEVFAVFQTVFHAVFFNTPLPVTILSFSSQLGIRYIIIPCPPTTSTFQSCLKEIMTWYTTAAALLLFQQLSHDSAEESAICGLFIPSITNRQLHYYALNRRVHQRQCWSVFKTLLTDCQFCCLRSCSNCSATTLRK